MNSCNRLQNVVYYRRGRIRDIFSEARDAVSTEAGG